MKSQNHHYYHMFCELLSKQHFLEQKANYHLEHVQHMKIVVSVESARKMPLQNRYNICIVARK